MSLNKRRNQSRSSPAVASALLLAAACLGQYALDANFSSSGRINPKRQSVSMAAPLYSVNRSTGNLVYNPANAFRDAAYKPYVGRAMGRPVTYGTSVGSVRAKASGPVAMPSPQPVPRQRVTRPATVAPLQSRTQVIITSRRTTPSTSWQMPAPRQPGVAPRTSVTGTVRPTPTRSTSTVSPAPGAIDALDLPGYTPLPTVNVRAPRSPLAASQYLAAGR
jgi:hypothetical protein